LRYYPRVRQLWAVAALAASIAGGAGSSEDGLYRERLPAAGSVSDGSRVLEIGADPGEFTVRAPGGWVLDTRSGARQRLRAVFYPEGGSWVKSEAVMYIKTVARCCEGSLDDFIKGEVREFTEGSAIKASPRKPITTRLGKKAQVRYFSGGRGSNFESVAYLEEPSLFIVVVLSGQSAKAHDSSRAAFVELVRSYSRP
jgi:hypothetical protein